MSEPKIVHKDAFLVGGCLYVGKNENNEIPAMWDKEFLPRAAELQPGDSKPRVFYGVCRCAGKDDGSFEYLAAADVDSLDNLPQGMVGWEIPEQTYAVFEVNGLKDLHQAFERAYGEWLPKSQYDAAEGPMFEYYPETFCSEDSMLYIYIAVKPKA